MQNFNCKIHSELYEKFKLSFQTKISKVLKNPKKSDQAPLKAGQHYIEYLVIAQFLLRHGSIFLSSSRSCHVLKTIFIEYSDFFSKFDPHSSRPIL